jgi:hypothetical protein
MLKKVKNRENTIHPPKKPYFPLLPSLLPPLDKFTQLDELAYQSGIDTNIPDKGPNQDKIFSENLEKHQYLQSREGRLGRAALIAEHMDYNELKRGKMESEKMHKIVTQGRYVGHHDGEATHGKFISNLDDDQRNVLDKRAQNDDDDDQDDLFNDDDDDDFQRELERIKIQRLNDLKKQAKINGNSLNSGESSSNRSNINNIMHSHDANDVDEIIRRDNGKKIPVANGVKEIIAEEFEAEIKNPSKSGTVFMLVYKANNRASDIMLNCLNSMARRLKNVKMCVILYSPALLHVPEQHCPILMCYQKGDVVANFAKLDHFRGSSTTALDVEWKLAEAGIIETTLQEDPRDSALFD